MVYEGVIMLLTALYYHVLSSCLLIGTILCSSILESSNEMKCNTHCPYGFVPDVEGFLTCRCFNPCSMIMCLGGTVCVAEMPRNCEWEPCRPMTSCREVLRTSSKTPLKDSHYMLSKWRDVLFQGDQPDRLLREDVCSQPMPSHAVTCKRKRRRWYYSSMTGKCVRFMGCDTTGNNFSRKRYCKSMCRRHVIHPAKLRELQADEKLCSMPRPTSLFCEQTHRRWYFNDATGKCEKFVGCPSYGNNFSRKIFCKATCKHQSKSHRQLFYHESDSKEHPPR